MLAFAQDVVHLISYGCYQYDAYKGWQTVKPCPAHVICGRLPNVYDMDQQTHCPADFHFRFPHALGSRGPKVFNPLLAAAVKQYQNHGPASSVLQLPGVPAGLPRFREHAIAVSGGASALQPQAAVNTASPSTPAIPGNTMRLKSTGAELQQKFSNTQQSQLQAMLASVKEMSAKISPGMMRFASRRPQSLQKGEVGADIYRRAQLAAQPSKQQIPQLLS
eukprot:g23.t1